MSFIKRIIGHITYYCTLAPLRSRPVFESVHEFKSTPTLTMVFLDVPQEFSGDWFKAGWRESLYGDEDTVYILGRQTDNDSLRKHIMKHGFNPLP